MRFSRYFLLSVFAITVGCYLFVDQPFQSFFFDAFHNKWVLNAKEPLPRLIFYNIPKNCFGCLIALLFLRAFILPRGGRFLVVASMVTLTPIIVGFLKLISGHECPKDLLQFGGSQTHLAFLDAIQVGAGRCFPAGHASAGFGLYPVMALFSKPRKWIVFFVVTLLGNLMAFYQVANGNHFLSHQIATMGLAFATYMVTEVLLKKLSNPLNQVLATVQKLVRKIPLKPPSLD